MRDAHFLPSKTGYRVRAVVLGDGGLRFAANYQADPNLREIPVTVLLAGICETDLQLVQGYMGFQGVPGHEFVGVASQGRFEGKRVVGEINCGCQSCQYCHAGMQNHCPGRSVIGILNRDGAFAETVYVPEQNLHQVVESISNETAVFVEPLAAAFRIPEQLDMSGYEKAVVVGDGRMAYLIAQVLGLEGCEVTVIGKHASKLTKFQKLGILTRQLDDSNLREFPLAIDCTGSVTGIPTALRYLQPRGTLVLKTTTSEPTGTNLAPIVIDEVTIVGSRCGPFDIALGALQRNTIEVESLISARFPLERANEAFQAAADKDHGKVLFSTES